MDMLDEEKRGETAGTAEKPPEPPRYQGYQQYRYPPPRNDSGIAALIKNPMYVGLGILVSVFLIWLGLLFEALTIGVTDSGQIKVLLEIGIIIYNLGMAGLVVLLLSLGIGRGDYPQWLRAVMVFGAVLILIWGLANMVTLMTAMLNGMSHAGMLI